MENQPKNQNNELEAGLGILQDTYKPISSHRSPQRIKDKFRLCGLSCALI